MDHTVNPNGQAEAGLVRTMCPMNCHPTLCGMKLRIDKDDIVEVSGDPQHPDSRGFLCVRGRASVEIRRNPKRLLAPLWRDSQRDEFRACSWDEALKRMSEAIAAKPAASTAIWSGHGSASSTYGTRVMGQLMARFARLHGSQFFSPTMICWGLGAFGLGLTGLLEPHSKEDLGDHADMVLMWGANFSSQPNTAPHVLRAKRRGAYLVCIDVRYTEAAAQADEVLLIRPGSDTALALSMLHVICHEGLIDQDFIVKHTVGFDALAKHVKAYPPTWAAQHCGLPAEQIVGLARRYASTKPAMIVLGGSSMHKGANQWQASRAVSCLAAITGQIAKAGSGLGPRHGSGSIGQGLGSLVPPDLRDPAQVIPNQMSSMLDAMEDGRIKNLMLFGTNMLSSFPQRARLSRALQALDLVVSHDLFMNETAASHAQLVLPSTAWLEELGCKMTHTHLYLSDALLAPEGECRSTYQVLNDLARLLSLEGFHPWKDVEAMFDAVIDQPFTGHASIASLRAGQGRAALKVSHIGHADLHFDTPSGKLELYSEQAEHLGLSPLPDMPLDEIEIVMTELDLKGHHSISSDDDLVPISERVFRLAQGRTLHHFHGFYNNGTALPSLANKDAEPWVLMASADAHALDLKQDDPIVLYNKLGKMAVHVRLHERLPQGTLWIRDGWPQLNALSDASPILPDAAVDLFRFSAGQSRFDPRVYLARAIG
ncbi:MAG: molybdopterin-containing oxidoreductase family protein [Burkholderiaceae bacterium]